MADPGQQALAGEGALIGEQPRAGRAVAASQTLLVTTLWATSWVLIKIGLEDLDLRPVSFAGVRYALAAVILAPLGWRALSAARSRLGDAGPDRPLVARAALLGLLAYTLAQGAQFAALAVLPAASVGLILATIPIWVGAIAWRRGAEAASRWQAAGLVLLVLGAALYFRDARATDWLGLLIAGISAAASATGQHLARDLVRDAGDRLGGPVGLTWLSMSIGAAVLLVAGVTLDGVPSLDGRGWAIVAWLAAVNTAFAFTLFNRALRVLTAVESSVIVNLLLVMVAGLAWLFLGESLDAVQVAGLAAVTLGVFVVQLAPLVRRWPGPRVRTPRSS